VVQNDRACCAPGAAQMPLGLRLEAQGGPL